MAGVGWGRSMLEVALTSADLADIMDRITAQNIGIFDVQTVDELTVRVRIHRADFARVLELTEKRGGKLAVCSRLGLYWKIRTLLRRPVLVTGAALLIALSLVLPERIYYVEVEGNSSVPARQILEAAQESGIRFGAIRREVRSERMKNALLARLPALQWAGVNTYGSRAVITVRERAVEPEEEAAPGISSIVADRDGVILSSTVRSGTARAMPGQAVKEGDVLISGITDCGITVRAERAEGEVFAATSRELTVLTPLNWQLRVGKGDSQTKYSLIIGKKRINFYKGSGISDAGCVKMYSEYVLKLPGGFALPVVLVVETVTACDVRSTARSEAIAGAELSEFADRYLRGQMIAGTVLSRDEQVCAEDAFRLTGRYACKEMIGRERSEEIGEYHGKTD